MPLLARGVTHVMIYANFSLIFVHLWRISTNFWRGEESSSLRRGQALTSQPQDDREEENRLGQPLSDDQIMRLSVSGLPNT